MLANISPRALSIVALFAFCSLAAAAPSKDLLKRVCKGEKIHLTQSALNDLAQEIRQQPPSPESSKCSQEALDSVVALERVLSDEESICSPRKAEQIVEYFVKHVLDKRRRAPAAVGLLYTSYGMKVSKVCRRRMVSSISEAQNLLSEPQLEEFDSWTNERSFIAHLLPEPKQYDDLVLPKQLARFLETKPEKMYVQTSTSERLRKLQVLCERRLKPIYEPLIVPLIDLAAIGFNYKNSQRIEHPENPEVSKLVFKWYRAVFLCESLANMILVNESNLDKTEATDRTILRIIPQKDIDESDKTKLEKQQLANSFPEIEQLEYSPPHAASSARLSEPIVDPEDEDLSRAIKKFKRHRQASSRLINKMFGQFKEKMARGALKLVPSHLEIPDSNQMIKFLEDYENNLTRSGSSAVSYSSSGIPCKWKFFFWCLGVIVLAGLITWLVLDPPSGHTFVYIWHGRG